MTALIWAAREGQSDCLRLLIDRGANKNAHDVVRAIVVIPVSYWCVRSLPDIDSSNTMRTSFLLLMCQRTLVSVFSCVWRALILIFRVFVQMYLHSYVTFWRLCIAHVHIASVQCWLN